VFAENNNIRSGSLFADIPEANERGFNSTEFNTYLKTRLLDIWAEQVTEEQYDNIYNALRWYYVNWPYLEDLDANREAFNKVRQISLTVSI
jgi:hypothetical protein